MPFVPPPNPYIAGKALDDERGFFDRQEILRDVERGLRREANNAIVLYGQRRIGKTSILLQLYRRLPIPPFVPVYFDLTNKARLPLKQLLYELAVEVANHVDLPAPNWKDFEDQADPFRQSFLPQVYEVLDEGQRPVLLLDEFDVWQAEAGPPPDSAALHELFPYLWRLLATEPRLRLVVAVGRRMADLSLDFYTTFKAALVKHVSVLSPDTARELILQAENAGSLRFEEAAVDRIQTLTNNHPYLVQLACQVVFDRAYEGLRARPKSPPLITPTEVEAAIPEILEAGRSAFQWIWESLPPAERVVFAAAAGRAGENETVGEEDISEALQGAGIRILVKELNLAPATLVEWQMLEPVDGQYRVSLELLRRWVAGNYPLQRIKDELDDISPAAAELYRAARDAYEQKELDRAVEQLEQALEVNPNHLQAQLLLGIVLRESGRLAEAAARFEGLYKLDSREAGVELVRTLLEQGAASEAAGDEAGAMQAYGRVLEISPRELTAQTRQAAIWQQRGDRALAGQDFETAAEAYRQAGHEEKLGQIEAHRRSIELTGLAAAAEGYDRAAEWAKSVEAYQRLLELEPDNETWQAGLDRAGEEVWLAQTYAEAVDALQQQEPDRAQPALARVIARRPNYQQAAELLVQTKGRRLAPPTPEPAAETRSILTSGMRYGLLGWAASGVVLLAVALLLIWFQNQRGSAGAPAVAAGRDATIEALSGTLEANAAVFAAQTEEAAAADTPTATATPMATAAATATAPSAVAQVATATVPSPPAPTPATPAALMGTPLPLLSGSISVDNADQVSQLAQWGGGMLWGSAVTYSPDGQLLAIASTLGVELYEASTLTPLQFIAAQSYVQSIAFSPDSRLLAAGSLDGKIRVWQVEDGELALTLEGHTDAVTSVRFSPQDSALLASGSNDDTVRLWRLDGNGEPLFILEGHTDDVNTVAFSGGGALLASGSDDASIRLWQVDDGALLNTMEGHTRGVLSVAFAPDAVSLVSGALDGTVRLWQVEDGALLNTLAGHSAVVMSVAFSPNGVQVASGSLDGTIRLWQAEDGALLNILAGHTGGVIDISFSPDGAVLASGALDGTVRLWQAASGQLLNTVEGHTRASGSVAFSPPDGATLASGTLDGTTLLWQVADGSLRDALKKHRSGVISTAFSPDGSILASGSLDGAIRLWQVTDGTLLNTMAEQTDSVVSLAFSPDGTSLASGSMDGAIRLWQVEDGALLNTLTGHEAGVIAVAFSPDGELLASGSEDTTVRLWQVQDGTLLSTLTGHTGAVGGVAFTPDGAGLASGAVDGAIHLWQVEDGTLLRSLTTQAGPVWTIALSPDGQLLASGALDGAVRLWQVEDGALLNTLIGQSALVWNVAFSPDGTLLASASPDGFIRLWGVAAE